MFGVGESRVFTIHFPVMCFFSLYSCLLHVISVVVFLSFGVHYVCTTCSCSYFIFIPIIHLSIVTSVLSSKSCSDVLSARSPSPIPSRHVTVGINHIKLPSSELDARQEIPIIIILTHVYNFTYSFFSSSYDNDASVSK